MSVKRPLWRDLFLLYRRRWMRRRRLWRALRSRHQLTLLQDNRAKIHRGTILGVSCLRNEAIRLPYFLDHYRRLGVGHFLIVDNGSDDGTTAYLRQQPDVSLWWTEASYRASRFGVDWMNWLMMRHAHGSWVVVADADEILIYPDWDTRPLPELTAWLDAQGQRSMGAIMLDMYPKGSPDAKKYAPGEDPFKTLPWFDAYGYWVQRQRKLDNLWLQGGPRARCFFSRDRRRAPTLNKIPLVRWNLRYAFVNSTHSALPTFLNHTFDEDGREKVSGVLLHTKFLPGTAARAAEEKIRDEHFLVGSRYRDYYDWLAKSPDFWSKESVRYKGWQQLLDLKLMFRGNW